MAVWGALREQVIKRSTCRDEKTAPEEQIVKKIMEVLAEDYEIEYIHISDAAVLTFGEMQINPGQRQIFQNGTEIRLTTREFDILYTLARYHNQVLTVQQI